MLVVTGCEEINNVLGNETGGDESNASSDNGTDETSDTTAPAEVTDLSATISSGEVGLNWTDPNADDLEHVEVTWSPEDGGSQPKKIDPGTEQAQMTGLTNGTEYTFTLKTVDTAGNASSGVTTVATPAAPPSAPSNLQLSVVSDTQIDLSWTDNAANETGFEIERDGTVVASDVAADTESYSDTGLSSNTSYDYRVRAVNAAGASAWTDQVSATTEYAEYAIGDTGPAGGIIFYDDDGNDAIAGARYLEAAPSDIDVSGIYGHVWGGFGTEVGPAAQGTAIGTGEDNTAAIVAEYGANEPNSNKSDYAARLADQYAFGGYTDWFLPSKNELDLMYQNKGDIGGFDSSSNYWSSSENYGNPSTQAWDQYFGDGAQDNAGKGNTKRVRAIRAF
jgi:hypothetical protein